MLDATAFELADFDWPSRYQRRSDPPKAHTDANEDAQAKEDFNVAALALAGCAACQQAIGDCAVHYAKTGAISPGLAFSICSSMQRLTQRAFQARTAAQSAYVAYVLFGSARNDASRRADVEALAETMR
jgi:hypothetical protein